MPQGNKSAPDEAVLERTLDFPCHYVLKVFGPATQTFEDQVMARAESQLGANRVRLEGIKKTRSGDRMSLSVGFEASNPAEIVGIYERIATCPGLITMI